MSTVQLEAARGHIRKGVSIHHLHLHNIHIHKYILNRHYKRYKQIRKLQWAGLYSVVIPVYMTEHPYTTQPYIQTVKIFELSFFSEQAPSEFFTSRIHRPAQWNCRSSTSLTHILSGRRIFHRTYNLWGGTTNVLCPRHQTTAVCTSTHWAPPSIAGRSKEGCAEQEYARLSPVVWKQAEALDNKR